MSISVQKTGLHVLNMKTRMPFRYGIASLVSVPHLFVRLEADINGSRQVGIADTAFSDDLY